MPRNSPLIRTARSNPSRRPARLVVLAAVVPVLAAATLLYATGAFAKHAANATSSGDRVRPGEIPFGEWMGEGTFVYDIDVDAESPIAEATRELVHDLTGLPADEVPVNKDAEPAAGAGDAGGANPGGANGEKPGGGKRKSVDRRYRTELSIQPQEADGRELVIIAIRSRRGPLPDLDNESRVLLALEKTKAASPMIGLYKVVGFAFNAPSEATSPQIQEMGAAAACTCITRDDVTILQIRYMDNFVDTFRFEEDRVEKSGVFGSKSGFIHWVEELRER